jgi:twitching motility protein PilT
VFDLMAILKSAVEQGASDVHLKLGQPPVIRHDGDLEQMDAPPLKEGDLEDGPRRGHADLAETRDTFEDTGDLDIAYSNPTLPRFRVNGFRQRGATSFAFRVIRARSRTSSSSASRRRHPPRRGASRASCS